MLSSATGRECDISPATPWLDTPRCTDLTKVRAYSESYSYDDLGSLLRLVHRAGTGGFTRAYHVAPSRNQAVAMTSGTTSYAYAYDACGNMVSETTTRLFEWNHANQLATFRNQTPRSEPSVYTQYRYDTTGQRVLKIVRKQGGQLAVTAYIGGLFERIILTTSTATSHHDLLHILDGLTRIATVRAGLPLPADTSPPVVYHLGDHLGSSAVVLNASGAFFNREEYTPYGETSFGSYAKKRYRFTAKERDEESGLYYHGARNYAPWLSRWTSTDPLPKPSYSLYRYAAGNPMGVIDPSGSEDLLPPLAITLRPVPVPPRNEGSSLSADTATPAERLASIARTQAYLAFRERFPGTIVEMYELYSSAEEHRTQHDPVAWLSQFGTAHNMPGVEVEPDLGRPTFPGAGTGAMNINPMQPARQPRLQNRASEPYQMEFIEGPGYEMPATATATKRGFTPSHYRTVEAAIAEWMAPGRYDILHPPDKPFALLKPGETVMVRPGLSGPNRAAGASRDKLAIDAARHAGIPVRDPDTGLYPGAAKGTRYAPPRQK